MDKLSACKILGISIYDDFEAAREAYKLLVQEVHPEEDPESFSEIQTAYRYLLRLNSLQSEREQRDDGAAGYIENDFETKVQQDNIYADEIVAIDNELGNLFDDIEEGANKKNAAHIAFENDLDAITAFRSSLLHVKTIPPDYLAYLLKTYTLTKKDYIKLHSQLSALKNGDRRKRLKDITRPWSFIVESMLWFCIFLIVAILIVDIIIVGILLHEDSEPDFSIYAVFLLALGLTAVKMGISLKKAKAKKASNLDQNEILLTDLYYESINIVNEKRGIVPESKKEIYISCIVSALNAIPFILSGMSYVLIFNVAFVLFYYAFRTQWRKRSCGFLGLISIWLFQCVALASVEFSDLKENIIFGFLIINFVLFIYKIIALILNVISQRKQGI